MLGISHFGSPTTLTKPQSTCEHWPGSQMYVEAQTNFSISRFGVWKKEGLIEIDGRTPILLDGKQQQMLWQCLLSPFFAVYLKLNYVEKVMKREIGNGFSDKATSSTWLAKSKKLKKWTCEFDFCIGKRHQQYISTISCFSMMFLCIWKCWSSFGLCFITR